MAASMGSDWGGRASKEGEDRVVGQQARVIDELQVSDHVNGLSACWIGL